MRDRLLLVHSDRSWLEGLKLEFEEAGYSIHKAETAARAEQILASKGKGRFAAAVISAFLKPDSGSTIPAGAGLPALHLAMSMRVKFASLPVLFVEPGAMDVLVNYANADPWTTLIQDERVPTVLTALARLNPSHTQATNCATVEIGIDFANLTFNVTLGGTEKLADERVPRAYRKKLLSFDHRFEDWKLVRRDPGKDPRLTDDWARIIADFGEELQDLLFDEHQKDKLDECFRRLGRMDHIHFRFCLQSGDLTHVPFEPFWDVDKKRFVREIAPVARRILLNERERIRLPTRAGPPELTGPIVFVKSDAHGSLGIRGQRFAGADRLDLQQLKYLDTEWDDLREARRSAGMDDPTLLDLVGDAQKTFESLISAGSWDVVHFSGHSVRADSGDVFLILPGEGPGRLVPLPVAAFARQARDGGARLVILSCCESSSPDALFRLAQEGIPAAVGFRWEVNDKEAAAFTGFLHGGLARGLPVGRAYQSAIRSLKERFVASPTFASPILLVQDEAWATPELLRGGGDVKAGMVVGKHTARTDRAPVSRADPLQPRAQ